MPIVFQQPDPVAPNLSAAGGYAEEYAKLFPSIASLYGHLASQGSANASAASASGQQAQQFQTALNQRADMQTQALQGQANMQQAQQTATSQEIDQRTINNAWLNQQELTQSDVMRLNRMEQGVSAVEDAVNKGTLTREEGDQLITQYRTGIDPLRQRQEAAKAQLEQQLAQKQIDVHTRQVAAQKEAAKFMATNVQNGVATLPDPNNPGKFTQHIPIFDINGTVKEWHQIKHNEGGSEVKNAQAEKRQETQIESQVTKDAHAAWNKANNDAYKEMMAEALKTTGKDENGKPIFANPKLHDAVVENSDRSAPNGDTRPFQEWEVMRRRAAKGVNTGTPEEYAANRIAEWKSGRTPGTTPPGGNVASPGQTQAGQTEVKNAGPGEAKSPATGEVTAPKPFEFSKPEGKEQTEAVRGYQTSAANLSQTDLHITNPDAYREALSFLTDYKEAWQKYGSAQAMPEDVREKLVKDTKKYNTILQKFQAKRNAPLPKPTPAVPWDRQGLRRPGEF